MGLTAAMLDTKNDIAAAIGQQVEKMIVQAKKDSEARVRHELNIARTQLQQMEALVTDLGERVSRCVRSNGSGVADPSIVVDRNFLSQKIAQLEQKWSSEVKALKQDLHRTILAHNHNSDLMRHHRDALDEARRRLDSQAHLKADQVDAQIEKVDRMLRASLTKQRALDMLTDRLTHLELQVNEMIPGAAAMQNPFAAMLASPPGIAGVGALGQSSGKKKKDGDVPSAEEVRERLLQAARAAQSTDGASNFNAEAPVFVPRGVADTGAKGDTGETSGEGEESQSGGDDETTAKKEVDA